MVQPELLRLCTEFDKRCAKYVYKSVITSNRFKSTHLYPSSSIFDFNFYITLLIAPYDKKF